MRRTIFAVGCCALLAAPEAAAATTLYLHRSAVPVAVPGGTTTLVLDAAAPAAGTPLVATASVPKNTSAILGTFVAPTFVDPADLGPKIDVVADLSANLSMDGCARVTVTIDHVDAGGGRTGLGTAVADVTIPRGTAGGTMGFAALVLSTPIANVCAPPPDTTIAAGESVAVTIAVENRCNANRSVSLAYDAASAPGAATFTSLLPLDPAVVRACYGKCQDAAAKALTKFWAAKSKCIDKCQSAARRGGSFADCAPPYGGATAACIGDPSIGAEARARASIVRACAVPGRCPPCYAAGDCTANAAVQTGLVEAVVDTVLPLVFCDPTADLGVVRCMHGNAVATSKFVAAKAKCYERCFLEERKGFAAPGSCGPPATDSRALTCIGKVEQRASASLDKYCFFPPAVAPACYASPPPLTTADAWVGLVEPLVDALVPVVYCGS